MREELESGKSNPLLPDGDTAGHLVSRTLSAGQSSASLPTVAQEAVRWWLSHPADCLVCRSLNLTCCSGVGKLGDFTHGSIVVEHPARYHLNTLQGSTSTHSKVPPQYTARYHLNTLQGTTSMSPKPTLQAQASLPFTMTHEVAEND